MLSSRLSVYFDATITLSYRHRQYEFFAGPEFRHLSNGGLVRPNKGINKLGIGAGIRYHLQPSDSIPLMRISSPFEEKRVYINIAYSCGIKSSQGEWLYDANNYIWNKNNVNNIKYGQDGYQIYYYHLVSTDFMCRYARRYASGIGFDALYEPYNREIEIQNNKADRLNLTKWSFGIAAKHEVYFRRLSMQMAIGWYLSRPFNEVSNTDEEYPYYERIGLRYNLPLLNNSISVGYNIYAHLTIAYGTEIVIGFKLPTKKF